jgi:DNA-binding transcriptional regulator YiaG
MIGSRHMRKIATGEDIKAWRRANAYDQDFLARELGVTRQTVGNWERKKDGIPRYIEIALQALEKYPSDFTRYFGRHELATEERLERS